MNNLKAARKKKGLTQIEVAKYIGLTQGAYSAWENGHVKIDSQSLARLAELFGVSMHYLLGEDEDAAQPKAFRIPVLGEVAAGLPMMAEENIVDYEEIDPAMAATGELFGLRIKGSSMEPRIKEGDVVIVRKQEDVDTGDTAVVLVNGDSATVKRIKKETNGITLVPNNTAFSPIYYSNDDIERLPVRIIGKVLELRGKL